MSLAYDLFRSTGLRNIVGDFRKSLMRDKFDYSQSLEITKLMPLLSQMPNQHILDIGAHDGKTYSNSYPLLKRGWKGYLVEPNPRNTQLIKHNCAGCDYELIEAAITTNEAESVNLYYDKVTDSDLRASIKEPDSDSWAKENLSKEFTKVKAYTLDQLVNKYKIPHDLAIMSLDIEGMDTEVIQTLGDLRPYILLIEIDFTNYSKAKDKVKYLNDKGYLNTFRVGCNEVFICTDYKFFERADIKKFIEYNF